MKIIRMLRYNYLMLKKSLRDLPSMIPKVWDNLLSDLYNLIFGPRVSLDEQILFFLQLHSMFKSGIPLTTGLKAIHAGWRGRLKDYIYSIYRAIYSGKSLSQALELHASSIFPPIVISIIKAGEYTGNLDKALELASRLLETKRNLSWAIISSLTYPAVIIIAGISGIVIFNSFFLSTMIKLYQDLEVPLPKITKMLIAINHFLNLKTFTIIGLFLLILGLFLYSVKYIPGLNFLAFQVLLKLPIIGDLYRKYYLSYLMRMMYISISSGVSVSETLKLLEKMSTPAIAKICRDISDKVYMGSSIYKVMKEYDWFFGRVVIDMMRIYEETSREDLLKKIADMMEFEYRLSISNFLKVIEPMVMGLMGGFVLFMAAGIFAPMVKLFK